MGARGRLLPFLAALGAVVGLLAPTSRAAADPQQSQQQLQDDVEEATADEARLLDAYRAAVADLQALDAKVAQLDAKVAAASADLDAADRALAAASLEARRRQEAFTAVDTHYRGAVDLLRNQAVAAFMDGGRSATGSFDQLLGAGTVREFGEAKQMADTVVGGQNAVVNDVHRLRDQVGVVAEQAAEARGRAVEARAAADALRVSLERDRGAVVTLRDQANAKATERMALVQEAESRKAEFEAQLAAQQVVSGSLGTMLRAAQAGQPVAPARPGTFVHPIPGVPITSGFGPRVHPIFHDVRVHTGIDFGAPSGTPIGAAAPGTVVLAGVVSGYGNTVVIDHGNGLATLYGHQSALNVAVGKHVDTGDVIGWVGTTGNSTGPHLHFEVRVLGTPVDPMPYL